MGLLLKAEGLSELSVMRRNEAEKLSRGGLVVGSKKVYIQGEVLSFNHLVEYRVEQSSQDHSFYYCINRGRGGSTASPRIIQITLPCDPLVREFCLHNLNRLSLDHRG